MKHPCTLCEASFARPSKLTIHIRKVHLKEVLFPCHVCNKDFHQAGHLKRHVKNCHEKSQSKETKPSFKCGVAGCLKLFQSVFGLTRHLDSHFGGQKFKCLSCAESFKTKNLLDRHTFTHTGKVPYQCEVCSAKFFELHLFNKHKRQSHSSKVYICHHADCNDMQFDNISAYRKHKSEVHKIKKKFTCAICHRKFQAKAHLAEHILGFHECPNKTFACPFDDCDKVYNFHRNLTSHIKVNHLNKRYPCSHPGCSRSLASQQKLRHHLKLHEKSKEVTVKNAEKGRKAVNLIASISQEEKSLIENLENPITVTTNDDLCLDLPQITSQSFIFKCCVGGCTKSFLTKFGLTVHLRVHFEEGKFKCSFCPQSFRAKSKLDKHTFTHTGKMPFECGICPAKFFDRHTYKRHSSEVHSSKIYKCNHPDCHDVQFDKISLYRRHKKEVHDRNQPVILGVKDTASKKPLL